VSELFAIKNAELAGRRAGRVEERIIADKEIAAIKADCEARVQREIDSRQPKIDEARALGAAESARRVKEAMAMIISRTNLSAAQRAMLVGLIGSLDAPLVPDIVTQQKARIDELETELTNERRRMDTQIGMKQNAIAGRAQALAGTQAARDAGFAEGAAFGLSKAAEFIGSQKLRPADTKGPTKLAKELAAGIMDLGKSNG
jgi:hypothetical protein